MSAEQKLKDLGLELPAMVAPSWASAEMTTSDADV